MNRIVVLTLLALLLSGCRITTVIVGEGTVTSQSGSFNCTTGNAGACNRDYPIAGSEVFIARPAPGWTFAKWTNCNYVSILSCATSFNQNLANGSGVWTVTATFKPINPPVQAATYTYNALGQRMTRKISSMTTLYQYDLEGNLIAELNSTGQALRQHIYINNEPIAQLTRKSDGTLDVQYVHTDHLGTPTLLTNQSGNVVADLEAMPFGETFVDYAEVEYNKRFPGQYKDAETGLHYNYFRDYDPSTGRYIQSDPVGLQGGLNTYDYVGGKPIITIDPFGLDAFLASRPTAGGAKHMFIVYGADPRGIGGVIRSFGRRDGGMLGEVDLSTGGFSRGTLQKDQDYWKLKPSDLSSIPIPASDAQVECAANNITSRWRYTFPRVKGFSLPTSGHATMNSNTAAQAVANYAAGIPVVPPVGWHPGAENAAIIGFSE